MAATKRRRAPALALVSLGDPRAPSQDPPPAVSRNPHHSLGPPIIDASPGAGDRSSAEGCPHELGGRVTAGRFGLPQQDLFRCCRAIPSRRPYRPIVYEPSCSSRHSGAGRRGRERTHRAPNVLCGWPIVLISIADGSLLVDALTASALWHLDAGSRSHPPHLLSTLCGH